MQQFQRSERILFRVERKCWSVFGQLVTVAIVGLFLLETPRIGQEYLQKVCGAARAVNWTMKTMSHQARQITGVVDVCVSDQNSIQRTCIEGRLLPVSFAQFLQTLEESAINEDVRLLSVDQVLRSGDGTNAAPKF